MILGQNVLQNGLFCMILGQNVLQNGLFCMILGQKSSKKLKKI